MLEEKFFTLSKKILQSNDYNEKVKALIIRGYENAAKNFKGKLFVLQKLIPIISDYLNTNIEEISDYLVEYIMKLHIKVGGFLEKVFIPGVTAEN